MSWFQILIRIFIYGCLIATAGKRKITREESLPDSSSGKLEADIFSCGYKGLLCFNVPVLILICIGNFDLRGSMICILSG